MSGPPSPSDQTELVELVHSWVLRAAIDDEAGRSLLHDVMPTMWEAIRPVAAGGVAGELVRDRVLRAAPAAPRMSRAGDVLAISNTANQQRAVAAILETQGGAHRRFLPVRPGSGPSRAARSLLSRLIECGPAGRVDRGALARRVLKADRVDRIAHAVLSGAGVLVVANQHLADHRALIRRARGRGVPSLYFPHAPVASRPNYRDLPTDLAGLRGQAELDLYDEWGADTKRLALVGDPSLAMGDGPRIVGDDVVFAISPRPAEILKQSIQAVRKAAEGRVIVAPHPSMNATQVRRLLPPEWSVWGGRTADLLEAGRGVLIQMSSGVGCEALTMGVPVVELSVEKADPAYPVLDHPLVPQAHDAATLVQALDRARSLRDRREDLAAWARTWCASWGIEAAGRAGELIHRARVEGANDRPVLDGWPLG